MSKSNWYEDADETQEGDQSLSLIEYDISAAPNDFNVNTIFDLIQSGLIQIPPFQRHFVWDQKRASRLIESLIMGLPIPQIFLYEQNKNQFLVIDGQQRLLSIYFFLKGRFPLPKARAGLRQQLKSRAVVPDEILTNDELFTDFELTLPMESRDAVHPLEGKRYLELASAKTQLDLRTIRIVIVKQAAPKGDDAIYEIFNRLNSGGVNLTAQEIRFSLYHGNFLQMLAESNFDEKWRKLLGQKEPDVHFRDVEFLLRGVALLLKGNKYQPSMARFLNEFCREAETFSDKQVLYFRTLIGSFLDACEKLPDEAFFGLTRKFTVSIFDAVFAAACTPALSKRSTKVPVIDPKRLKRLKSDQEFISAAQARTTGVGNVKDRIAIAKRILTR